MTTSPYLPTALKVCPWCQAALVPVALCDGVWGCKACNESWFAPKREPWVCCVTAESHRPDGRRVRMRRYVDGLGDVVGAMLNALKSRRDGGTPFLGCEVRAVTPLGQVVRRVLNPDTWELEKSERR